MTALSPAGLAWIAHAEGFKAEAYPDHKGQSIGYGHLILPWEKFEGPITVAQGLLLLEQDAGKAAEVVNRAVTAPLSQAQFDALVDFTFNEGALAMSKVAADVNARDYKAVAVHLKLYNKMHVNGELVDSPGLTARRAEEAKAFEG